MERLVSPWKLFDYIGLWDLTQISAPTTDTFSACFSLASIRLPIGSESAWTGIFGVPGCSNFLGCLWNTASEVEVGIAEPSSAGGATSFLALTVWRGWIPLRRWFSKVR